MDTAPSPPSGPARDTSTEAKALQHLAQRLQSRFSLPASDIDAEIAAALAGYSGRPIRDFVPILVEREVLDRLRERRSAQTADVVPAW